MPSQYDGDITVSDRAAIEDQFEGLTIIADNHYTKCKDHFRKVTFITPYSHAGRPKVIKGKKVPFQLTIEQEKHNSDVLVFVGKWSSPLDGLPKNLKV